VSVHGYFPVWEGSLEDGIRLSAAAPARLPWPVRALNAAGAAVRALGVPLLPIDGSELAARARKATGLEDFGDPFFREGLERVTASLEGEARLSSLGRSVARSDLQRILENRLRVTDVLLRHPEIETERIEAPIFIVGAPRTGTSILHELLAQDPRLRVPRTWEVMYPWPPPETRSYETDPRIARVERHFSGVDRLLPTFKRMHPMGARLPQECAVLTAHECATMVWHTQFDVPSYQAWFETADHRRVYQGHRRLLQYLQWQCPGSPWVLKSPQHLWTLDALFEVYPDARVVQTHRDPLKIVASLTSLCATLRSMTSDAVDPRAIGADWSRRLATGLRHTMGVREGGIPAAQVYDLSFQEFMKDEIASVVGLYAHFGMMLSAEAEARMRAFLAKNPRARHGRHRYGLEEAGLDETSERRRFAAYQERYAVPCESVRPGRGRSPRSRRSVTAARRGA